LAQLSPSSFQCFYQFIKKKYLSLIQTHLLIILAQSSISSSSSTSELESDDDKDKIHNDLLNSHNFTKFQDTGIGQCLTWCLAVWFGMFLGELSALQSPRQTFLFKVVG
jgi:hypothetical protein